MNVTGVKTPVSYSDNSCGGSDLCKKAKRSLMYNIVNGDQMQIIAGEAYFFVNLRY